MKIKVVNDLGEFIFDSLKEAEINCEKHFPSYWNRLFQLEADGSWRGVGSIFNLSTPYSTKVQQIDCIKFKNIDQIKTAYHKGMHQMFAYYMRANGEEF